MRKNKKVRAKYRLVTMRKGARPVRLLGRVLWQPSSALGLGLVVIAFIVLGATAVRPLFGNHATKVFDLTVDALAGEVDQATQNMQMSKPTQLPVQIVSQAKVAKPTPVTTAPSSSRFTTLPVGASLPSDASCAARVRAAPETREANKTANNTKGSGGNSEFPRVTGDFVGSTDEILQWAACKWGIDEDTVRAQAVNESWWFHRTNGDFTTDVNLCAPDHKTLGADGVAEQCPESIGLLQVRYIDHTSAFLNNNALRSTAYNVDYAYAVWRDCYEGNLTWLNTVERGRDYAAGDEWGCVGEWFSGRWYTPETDKYINDVKNYKNQRMWENPDFLSAT